ncbi:MAG TPA: hypothetical protein VLG40_01875 [Candidatus Saccharimonas sp.]|nr:hypothetical protein [Candidatus Saccharimonas sp.]
MNDKILFLDLDRTLFDTPRFTQALWYAIGHEFKVDAAQQLESLPEWYHQIGDLRYYHFEEHVKHVLHKTADEITAKIRPRLERENFLYPDTSELQNWQTRGDYQLRILSFGGEWLQKFKISLCPRIADLPADIILEPKNTFIAHNYSRANGFLVDDKRNLDLPRGFTEVWLRRELLQKTKESGLIIVNSLIEVTEAL